MKIALLSQCYPPMVSGAALFVERLAAGLAERGHQVRVLAASDRVYPYRLTGNNLIVDRVASSHNPFRVGQRTALWPHRQIIQSLTEFAPDIIHLHDPVQFAISGFSFSRPCQIPVILTIHALPWFLSTSLPVQNGARKMIERGLWRYARWLVKRCNGSVVATQTIAEVVNAYTGVLPQIISCGVDLETFTPACSESNQATRLRASLGIPEGAPVLLYVGRLDVDKQVDRVIQAAALTLQQTPAHLLIVGDGTEKAHLEQLSTRLGIRERSHFTGYVTAKDGLPEIYRMSTVLVTACEIETQGLVLLEAAACALPIVAVKATSLHEIVHEGENGYLAAPGNTREMADRLTWLVQNPQQSTAMGKAGREIVNSHASEKTIAAYESYYRSMLQSTQKTIPISSRKAGLPYRTDRSGECI